MNKQDSVKVLFLTAWYPNKHDPAAGIFVRKHAVAAAQNHDVTLLYIYADTELSQSIEVKVEQANALREIIISYKKAAGLLGKIKQVLFYIYALIIGLKRANVSQMDILHVNLNGLHALPALFYHFFYRKKYIVSEHWTAYRSGDWQKLSYLNRSFRKLVFKYAATITTCSEALKNDMLANGIKNKYVVLPNVVELSKINTDKKAIDSKAVHFFTAADFDDYKKNISGILYATKLAIDLLPEDEQNIHFHLAGDGKDRAEIEKLIKELELSSHVVVYGMLRNEEVTTMLQLIDFAVINSRHETFSVFAAEALMAGKAVICTRCGGPESFVPEQGGIIIDNDNIFQLRDALLKMFKEHKNYGGSEVAEMMHKRFSATKVAKKIKEIYASVLN